MLNKILAKIFHSTQRAFVAIVLFCISQTGYANFEPRIQEALDSGNFDEVVTASMSQAETPIAQLIAHSRQLKLSERPMWNALMHYHSKGSGWESQIDAPYFFLSEQGKNNPQSELEATLAAMFSNAIEKPRRLTAACRFVARRQWLKESLGETGNLIPLQQCPEFDRYKKFFAADVLTVIFPSAHPNSPSSAFGHTLLRLDKKGQDANLKMLNQSLNFAAEVPENVSPLTYAAAGIGGGFKGRFHILPYHIKLREYGQVDNRDIWEYELDLEADQVDWVLTHSYEMLIAWFDYFFFRENCSYHLLSLLDVAFPQKRLTEPFDVWAIPVDTIKVLEQNKLIRETRYVGSLAKQIRVKQKTVPIKLTTQILKKSSVDFDSLALSDQANVLDLAVDYSRYQRLSSGGPVTRLSKKEKLLLKKRSKISLVTKDTVLPKPDFAPDEGHGTGRVQLGVSDTDGIQQFSFQFRPAYHDFLDPSPGYGDNTAIDFGSTTVAGNEEGDFFLKEFIFLDIQSVEPRDRFFKPISWRTRIAANKHNKLTATNYELLGGAGLAYRSNPNLPLTFVFAETRLIRDRDREKRTTVGGKLRSGFLWEPVLGYRLETQLGFERDLRNDTDTWQAEFNMGISLHKDWSMTLGIDAVGGEITQLEATTNFGLRHYF